jgi:putative serine protease PepD
VAGTVLPSVVTIGVQSATGNGSGSGSIIRDGYVLTNYHVIATGAAGGQIFVLFADGSTRPATVTGVVESLDLAVLQVDTGTLPVIAAGDSDALQVGQPVVALGAPLGLDGTVTAGIVSALGREITLPLSADLTARIPGGVQTDASINPGNSGGALVDCAGRQIGVNTAIATVPTASGDAGGGSVGIGFAIPFALASKVADQLIQHGRLTPPGTGLHTLFIPPVLARQTGAQTGLLVRSVDDGGPSAAAGLQVGDVITTIDGVAVSHGDALVEATLTKAPGDQVTLGYLRSGTPGTATVTLA